MVYQHFAAIYDHLMQDAPYNQWLEHLQAHHKELQPQMRTVVDLGCGTGTLAISLAQQGYEVIGVDFSEDMLAIAAEKSLGHALPIQWLAQDMRELEVLEPVDTVICFCDSLNYIHSLEDVAAVFKSVARALKAGGYFLFDVHSMYKLREIFGQETFASNEEDIALIWQSFWEEEERTVEHQLSFFVQQDNGLYERFDESHIQKGYEVEELCAALKLAGFDIRGITADFERNAPQAESERIFFTAQKKSKNSSTTVDM